MAEELVIRVKIDGMGGTGSGSSGGSNQSKVSDAGAAGVAGLAGSQLKGAAIKINKDLINRIKVEENEYSKGNFGITGIIGKTEMTKQHFLSADWETPYYDKEDKTSRLSDFSSKSFAGSYVDVNKTKFKALGAATVYKTASTVLSIYSHQTKDSQTTERINMGMKYAGYGMAIAMSGPAMPFVAAGIIGNEVANSIAMHSNYKYDRALEGSKIANITASVGDLSYGRKRGM